MIKIKWTDKRRYVPGVGIVENEQELIVSKDAAKAFIKQGQAVAVKKKKTPKFKEKD